MSFSCECFLLLVSGLCYGIINDPEECGCVCVCVYVCVWCVCVCVCVSVRVYSV